MSRFVDYPVYLIFTIDIIYPCTSCQFKKQGHFNFYSIENTTNHLSWQVSLVYAIKLDIIFNITYLDSIGEEPTQKNSTFAPNVIISEPYDLVRYISDWSSTNFRNINFTHPLLIN